MNATRTDLYRLRFLPGCGPRLPEAAAVKILIGRDGYYVPHVVRQYGDGGCGAWAAADGLATNALLPAIARARTLAERLGVPCLD